MTPDICRMSKEELLGLESYAVQRLLESDEVIYIAQSLSAFWTYDWEAAKQGKAGMHAILKSKRHSDGFFVSRILLAPENILRIVSAQIAMRLREVIGVIPDYVIGVPDGATKLGECIATILGARNASMVKDKNTKLMFLETIINPEETVLLVEDFCTRGTGFAEAVQVVKTAQPMANILPYDPVIINRGGLKQISVGDEEYTILPVVEWRVQDWEPEECPLCIEFGSTPIKPKETDENWEKITHSQL